MTDTLSKVLIFAAGAVIGSAVTWKVLKTKYEKLATEEIELAYERLSKKEDEKTEDIIEEEPEEEADEDDETDSKHIEELQDKLVQLGYSDYSNMSKPKGGVKSVTRPRVITPEEFDMEEDYEIVSLSYYTDGVLADEFGNVIEEVEDTVGCDSLNHFGDYENDPDCVYVKNDELHTVYEILLTSTKYSNDDRHTQVSNE